MSSTRVRYLALQPSRLFQNGSSAILHEKNKKASRSFLAKNPSRLFWLDFSRIVIFFESFSSPFFLVVFSLPFLFLSFFHFGVFVHVLSSLSFLKLECFCQILFFPFLQRLGIFSIWDLGAAFLKDFRRLRGLSPDWAARSQPRL